MLNNLRTQTVGNIVANNWKAASVFEKYEIEFCCTGNMALESACAKKNVKIEEIEADLGSVLNDAPSNETDYNSWELDFLASYIENTHHKYVTDMLPQIMVHLNKISDVHGAMHPELFEIRNIFEGITHELTSHMKKEEFMIFPIIKKMVWSLKNNQPIQMPAFGTIANPIGVMMQDHDHEGGNMREIAKLSSNYTVPADGCTTYEVAFKMLADFEKNLHKHIHLENNILFPKAMKLENQILSKIE